MPGIFANKMLDFAFRMMTLTFAVKDLLFPTIDRRVVQFGLREGMSVVDYGSGPGRYTIRFARLVGETGKVYAVDIQPLGIEMVRQKMMKLGLKNIVPVIAQGYNTGLPDHCADAVCALDMFFGLPEPTRFLQEVHRITKPDGLLILDDGHQSRQVALQKLNASGLWKVAEETKDHLKCVPKKNNVLP